MSTYVYDLETDGLYEDATKIHVLSYTPVDRLEIVSTHSYEEMLEFFTNAKCLIAHNQIRYDKRVLEKILGIKIKAKLYDTLPLAWYLDHKQNKHGLEVYGEKFKRKKPQIANWQDLTPEEYKHRCEEDVHINWMLWKDLTKRLMFLYKDREAADTFLRYLTFKMECAAHQEAVGWKLDKELCLKSVETLTQLQEEKVQELSKAMPKRAIYKTVSMPKNLFKKDGTTSAHGDRWFSVLDDLGLDRTHTEDVKVLKGYEEANPNSSDQVKDWLFSLGWKPCTFDYKQNEDGTERLVPQVRKDGDLAPSVKLLIDSDPAIGILDGLTVIQHRLSVFKGFLEAEVDGYVKAEIAGLTNTLRFKHSKPLVNLPGVDRLWGKEIRGCLIADEDEILCGADMVSLESTTKRHYMYPYDPDYVAEMSQPGFDEHLDLAKFAGKLDEDDLQLYNENKDAENLSDNLLKVVKGVAKVRKKFKPVNYSCVYGVGKVKLSRSTGMPEAECLELIKAYWDRNWAVKAFSEKQTIRKIGGEMWVLNPVSNFWISLRYEKDVFSSVNQSTGVYCFDSWLAQCWIRGIKGIFQAHDEVITKLKLEDKQDVYDKMKDAIRAVNDKLQLNVPLDVDPQFGSRYSDVH